MPTCIICLNSLRNPAALPCGHVFCYDCIVKIVRNVQPYTQQHFCPTCRSPYNITSIDSTLVPMHLRPHLTPAIRKLSLDFTIPSTVPGSSPASECDRLRAENVSLRSCCEVWRKRAAVHAAASLGLVGLARLARDHAMKLRKEKIELEMKYQALKRQRSPTVDNAADSLPSPPESYASPDVAKSEACPALSMFSPPSPSSSEDSYCSDCSDCEPLLKRRRRTSSCRTRSPSVVVKKSPASSPITLAPLDPPCYV